MSTSLARTLSPLSSAERRSFLRFETVLPVLIEVHGHGTQRCIARNVSCGGLCVELREPPAIGTHVRVWFVTPGGARIAAWGIVKNHYVFNYYADKRPRQVRGAGIRFAAFEDGDRELLEATLEKIEAQLH
ncbi:MAG: PilZ domain-containing protein [Myxococcales bacterium]|nr:PilZ domain-containing protein [Myxococcales bacterium]